MLISKKSAATQKENTGDGVDHINIYSRGTTELGRALSNFAPHPVKLGNRVYQSLEAYWYFLEIDWQSKPLTIAAREQTRLCNQSGFNAKQLGRRLRQEFGIKKRDDFQDLVIKAMRAKVDQHPQIAKMLKDSVLPFTHYYVVNGKPRQAGFEWIVEEWEQIRKELKER